MEDWGLHKWQMEAWTPSWSGDVEMEVLFEKISEIGNGHWTVGDGARGWKDLDGRDNDGIWKIGDVGWMDGWRDGETEELSVETDEVQVDSPRGCNALQLLCCSSTTQFLLNFYSTTAQFLLNFYSTTAQLLLSKMQLHRCVSWFGLQGQNNKKLCSVNFLKRGKIWKREIQPPKKREKKRDNL